MTHTPKPWKVMSSVHGIDITDTESYSIIDEVCLTDARLIAAAPELLEALEIILGYNSTGGINHGLPKRCVEVAKAAIAKAKNGDQSSLG